MTLEGSVLCNCWKEGKTKPFPLPDRLIVDDEGYLTLEQLEKEAPWSQDDFEKLNILTSWEKDCCEHADLIYSIVSFNWFAYRNFLSALDMVSWQNFPVLKENLPQSNHGLMYPTLAQTALEELQTFENKLKHLVEGVLVDSDTGEEIYSGIVGNKISVMLSMSIDLTTPTVYYGFDENGFFISKNETPLFRAVNIEQIVIETTNGKAAKFINLDSYDEYIGDAVIANGRRKLHIGKRSCRKSDFEHIVEPLKTIFNASILTGNPIRWS